MGINPKNRDDMFLAKAAGEEVDFSTIKPSTPVSDREKLLVQLGERIDNAGSGDSSTGDVLVVNVTVEDGDVISDKSFAEVETAINNGKAVLLCVLGEVFIFTGIFDDDSQDVRYARFYKFSNYARSANSSPLLTYEEYHLRSESNVLIYDSKDYVLTPLE